MCSFVRQSDAKEFQIVREGHWSDIEADDGEEDSVKWYGTIGEYEAYVSATKGHSYLKIHGELGCYPEIER